MPKIGIIGGSGLDKPDILKDFEEKEVETAYGKPSSPLITGNIKGRDVVIVSRHGRKHQIPPTGINNRANIMALKSEGCTHIIATTAVGSLRRDIERGDIVIPDQFIDFTRHRILTFHETFENGAVHTSMADPFDKTLREVLINSAKDAGLKVHEKGTVITIEGPRFSTRAESRMFRAWGADIINMSTAPEAVLANEASIPYAVVAVSTDYDCLFEDIEPVSWEEIINVFNKNIEKVKEIVVKAVERI